MSQLAMFSPDMQVRVNSGDNLGKKRGWNCERWGGGVKNVVKEEEEEGGGRKRERGRQEQKEDREGRRKR